MEETILTQTYQTALHLQAVISSIPESQFNTIPFPGSWTAGQVAEHIGLSATGVLRTIQGPVEPTFRDPFEKGGPIRDQFLDFSTRMQSPDSIKPSDKPKDREVLEKCLGETMTKVYAVAQTEDLSATCSGFEFPGSGKLTRLEWITFLLAHTERHIHQLKKIAVKLVQTV